jgi:hypothetical protein
MKKTGIFSAVLSALLIAGVAQAQSATIGPGTPCTVSFVNPSTNADGTPLTVPLQSVNFYLDPPATGPVIGTTRPTFNAALTNGAPGAANTVSLCKSVTAPISSGNHTGSVSWLDAGGESAGTAPSPFVFVGIPSATGSAVIYR